ncbi:MAG TPA: glycosyltransferase [Pirellulales bacterium]|nr:glycosyltransferase [Pirellulales bacterium]
MQSTARWLAGGSRGRAIRLIPRREPTGDVLLSYITRPFVASGRVEADAHTNVWECRQIAQTFLDFGYAVDVIDWNNLRFRPARPYRFLVDIGASLERLAPMVGPDCTKILHATGKHWLFQNRAEYERLAALMARRGVALQPRRIAPAGSGVEAADCLTVLGNELTIATLAYSRKPCYRIPLSTTAEFPWDDAKDFAACRRRFVWFGSSGMVHKGLDLALEAFAATPDLHLTVCGPVDQERDFADFYRRELYHAPNIRTVGWVDVAGDVFAQIVRSSGAIVYPSCSEGCAGSVVTSLHAGLVPIISRESGVDVGDFGVILPRSTVADVRAAAIDFSRRPGDELRRRSRAAWEYARSYHTRARFAAEFRAVVEDLLGAKTTRLPAAARLSFSATDERG